MSDGHEPHDDAPTESTSDGLSGASTERMSSPDDAARRDADRREGAGDEPERFEPGTVLAGRYRVISLLGKGGMGEVYRADDLTLGHPVALKFLPRAVESDPTRLERFRHEVRIGREVSHPNVCRVYDIGECAGRHFISMEYVDGEDLKSLLSRIGRLPQEKAVDIARQVCAGLGAAHDKSVLHRDLKPANIMLDGKGNVRITDFGIAALGESVEGEQARVGTPDYMAPEQIEGGKVTRRTDIYSLGLVLYELFTGKRAFDRGTPLQERDSGSITSLTSLVADLDEVIERVVMRCLERDPSKRPPSAVAVSAALPGGDPLAAALAAGEMPSPELVARSGRGERMHPAFASLLLALVVVIIAGVLLATARLSMVTVSPLDKPPAAMLDRAKEALERLGLEGEPAESTWGYDRRWEYLIWRKHDLELDGVTDRAIVASDLRERASRARPPMAFFWYRQTPVPWNHASLRFERGFVSATSPRWSIPGEIYLSLDLDGALRRLYVIPGADTDDPKKPVETSEPVEAEKLFALAQLDIETFEPTEPLFVSEYRVDERSAWNGFYPEDESVPIRVEMGTWRGRLVYFRYIAPWDDGVTVPDQNERLAELRGEGTGDEQEPGLAERLRAELNESLDTVLILVLLGVLGIGGVLTSRHIARGSADTRGAVRVGLYGAVLTGVSKWLACDTLVPRGQFDLLNMSWSAFMGLGLWSGYIAFEPLVRRRWPSMLVAWTRLLSGRFFDPLVGRSLLVGALAGVVSTALVRAGFIVNVADRPEAFAIFAFSDPRFHPYASAAAIYLVVPILRAFAYLLILLGVRRVVKRDWVAAVIMVVPLAIMDQAFGSFAYSAVVALVSATILVVLYLRFGVLAAVAMLVTTTLTREMPATDDLTVWTSAPTWPYLIVLGVIALWGFAASVGGTTDPRVPDGSTSAVSR